MEIESLIDQISELEEVVRKHINTHRYQVDFLKDSSNWNQICKKYLGHPTKSVIIEYKYQAQYQSLIFKV